MTRRHRFTAFLIALACLAALLPASAEPFVVMAYNVQNWLTTDRFVNNTRVPSAPKPDDEKDAAVAIIAAKKPAIIGVSEMGNREDLEDLRARLKKKGLDYPHVEWHEGIDKYRHIAVLSQFPIIARNSVAKVEFDLSGQPHAIQRGILDITVEPKKGYELRLVGLHLKSRRPMKEYDEAALRAKEAWFVRRHLDGILEKDPRAKLLLFGDLNTTKNEYPIKEIQGAFASPYRLVEIRLEDDRGERWTHFWTVADSYERIDFLMASQALNEDIDRERSGIDSSPGWLKGSDHRAIFTTIAPK